MGASSSKDLDEPLIGYKMPSDRSRVRSMRSYLPPGSTGPSFDPGFDGYDFLIIFARPGHVVDGRSDAARASWTFAEDVWFRATLPPFPPPLGRILGSDGSTPFLLPYPLASNSMS